MNDKISVIIPMYNEEKRINKCIDSLINQSYNNIEIIVINDGSTDNSLLKLKEYGKKIKVITIENSGQAVARNIGISKCTGKYIMFVDSDDYVNENIVEKLYNNIIMNESDISVCNIIKVFEDREIVFNNHINFSDDSVINFMLSHPGPVAKLYKKELFIKNDLKFLEKCIYEDLALTPVIAKYAKKVSYIEEALYYYVIHNNSTMTRNTKKLDDIYKVLSHLENNLSNCEEIEYIYIEHLLYSASLRYSNINDKSNILKISNIIKKKFPNWKNNKYYKKRGIKFKLVCNLAVSKKMRTLKLLNNIRMR